MSNNLITSIKTQYGTEAKLIKYYNCNNVLIEFQDEHKFRTTITYRQFTTGKIKNPYDLSVCGKGYIGVGKYSSTKNPALYFTWHDMIRRCYDTNVKTRTRYMTYDNCEVDLEFLNLQIFGNWFDENIYFVDNERMHLDKDILIKNNKIYSKDTCIFVPSGINTLFTKRQNKRRKDYPIGVRPTDSGKYEAYCSVSPNIYGGNTTNIYLGTFATKYDAFNSYKNFKESYIKQVADYYKNKIPDKLYNALYYYHVDIND